MNAGDVRRITERTVLTIEHGALETIHEHLWPHDGHETGGILLGHERTGRLDITVAGGPGPDAVRTSTSFHRDLHHARALSSAAWSAQRAVWIGEWHTHPHGPSHPSGQDLATYRALLAQPDLELSVFACLIVTPRPDLPSPSNTATDSCASTADEQPKDLARLLPRAEVRAWLCDSDAATRVVLHRIQRSAGAHCGSRCQYQGR